MKSFAILAVLALASVVSVDAVKCKNEGGDEVDWWFALKYPLAASQSFDGQHYSVIDSKTLTWADAKSKVTEDTSVFGTTLGPILASPKGDISYAFYNDEHPDGNWTEDYGHSKGAFAFDDNEGFFLHHSIPKFPNYADKSYDYGYGQTKYGQHAFCISLDLTTLDTIAYVLKYATPWVYSSNNKGSLGNVTDLLKGVSFNNTKSTSTSVTAHPTSNSISTLKLYGKTQQFGADMMDSVIAVDGLSSSWWSQSWLNSGGPLGAFCPEKQDVSVVDVRTMSYGSGTDSWDTVNDHSKWAISTSGGYVCMNDNNRVESQFRRGGLSVCFQQPDLYKVLKAGVDKEGECGAGPSPGPSPPSPPSGKCCYFEDKDCVVGDVCCKTGCKNPFTCSYKRSSCSGIYGQKHHCEWDPRGHGACKVSKAFKDGKLIVVQ
mmetsp:Transcript_42125/g.51138  ORF Transcript_42125/g.51138 Transcript_42125/m.51138 type:complete len:431 (-) Transcript_42125:447-1739(-)